MAVGIIDKNGAKWRVRVRKRGALELVGYFASRVEAEVVANRIHDIVKREVDLPSLESWGPQWLAGRAQMRSHGSQSSVWAARIETAPFFRRPLRDIRRADVVRWVRDAAGAAQTKRNALNLLRSALADALEEGLLKDNPARDISVPSKARSREVWTFLTLDEVRRLCAVATPAESALIRFAVGTGLRAGEQAYLETADIAGDAMVVRYGGPNRQPTKGGKPARIPLMRYAREALEDWRSISRVASPWVFPRARGGHRHVGHMLGAHLNGRTADGSHFSVDRFDVLTRAAGLFDDDPDRPLHWHSLRHTCGTLLAAGAFGRPWSLREVQEMLRHQSASTTERYAHFSGTLVDKAAKKSDSWLQSPL